MNITIVGTGYVGLVTGACLADIGINVTCLDLDEGKINKLKDGIIPIYEPGLEKLVKNNLATGRLHFTTDSQQAIESAPIILTCVGTPQSHDGTADLQYVLSVAKDIGRFMKDEKIIVTKSTVPVGTAQKVRQAIQAELDSRGEKIAFDVASNPEFLKEGAAVSDFLKPDRIVIGTDSEKTRETLSRLYAPFMKNGYRVVHMDVKSAEMTKYASNAMLATKISFMNEISRLCEQVGADIEQVRLGMGADKRIGYAFTHPGLGYGGSCFPKDVRALIKTGEENGTPMEILKSVDEVNLRQRQLFIEKIKTHFAGDLNGRTFAVWGLSFKPETDDIREAPALDIIEALLSAGAKVQAFDPIAINATKEFLGERKGLSYFDQQNEVLNSADALVLHTEWKPFKSPDFEVIKSNLSQPVIFDGRNQYDPEQMQELGITYYAFGRS